MSSVVEGFREQRITQMSKQGGRAIDTSEKYGVAH